MPKVGSSVTRDGARRGRNGILMAVAQAQHTVFKITKYLRELGKDVRFAIIRWTAGCGGT